jgi:hypothetical protein
VIDAFRERRLANRWLFILATSLLWTPFVTLGLLPLVAAMLVSDVHVVRDRLKECVSAVNGAGALIAAVLVVYFAARFEWYSLPSEYVRIITRPNGLIPLVDSHDVEGFVNFGGRYLLFCLAEFLLLSLLLLRLCRDSGQGAETRTLVKVAVITLLLLPFFRYGHWNDLGTRASVPSLFVILLASVGGMSGWRAKPVIAGITLLVLMLGSVTSLVEIRRHVGNIAAKGSVLDMRAEGEVANLFELQGGVYDGFAFVAQYLGAGDSAFWKYLARRTSQDGRRVAVLHREPNRRVPAPESSRFFLGFRYDAAVFHGETSWRGWH